MDVISNIPYISDKFFEFEKKLWRNTWLLAGREADLKEKGQYITFDISVIGVSIVIVRGTDNELSAYYNICPHRQGRLVCKRQGKKAAISCPYHGWTFQLDGKLRGIPEKQLFPNLDKADYSLVPVSVDTWGGFIFVNLDPEPEYPLKEYLTGLPAGLEEYLADPDWYWYTGYQKKFNANWKDLMNIQHEGYHASHVHKDTINLYFGPDDAFHTLFEDSPGACSRLTVMRPLGSEDMLDKMSAVQHLAMKYGTTSNWVDQDTSRAAKRVQESVNLTGSERWVFDCYTFFPNVMLFIGTDVIWMMKFWPVNAHEAEWEIDWLHKDKLQNFGNLFNREHGRIATRNALTEDWPVVEMAHENMRTGIFEKSTIGTEMEGTVSAYYRKLLKHLDIDEDSLKNEYT